MVIDAEPPIGSHDFDDSVDQRPGVLGDVAFCGTGASIDAMPTSCTYNHRIERLIVSVPEPGFVSALALGVLLLGFGARGCRRA